MEKIKVLFLDRDGVINEDLGYVHRIEDFKFLPDIFKLCNFFINQNYQIIIITNQSGISRGFFTEKDFIKLTTYMVEEFKKRKINILDVFYCSEKDNSPRRKPNPGMFLEAISKYNIDINNSINIGDKQRDLDAGIKAGILNNFYINEILDKILKNDFKI